MAELIRTKIGGAAVAEIARAYGTPTYVYEAARVEARIAEFAPFQIDALRYAQKANSNLAILDLCRRHGAVVDAVSAGEILRALAAGYAPRAAQSAAPPPIVYTADVFSGDALALVLQHGIHVNCGSEDMLLQYAAALSAKGAPPAAAAREVTLRVNPGFGHGHSRKTNTGGAHSKHGIWHAHFAQACARAASLGLRVTGVHAHIGSGADLRHLARVAAAVEKFARAAGPQVQSISAGGGLPVPYQSGDARLNLPAYFATWDAARQRLQQEFGHPVRLEVEPGRYLAADAGTLITQVRACKRQGENEFALVDAGFNTLARPVLYGAYHPMALCPADGDCKRPLRRVLVGGPLCEAGDIFTQAADATLRVQALPQPRCGDWLLMEMAGAYGFAMASNYNSHPLPAELMVAADGAVHCIRPRQNAADLFHGETIPPAP